MKTIQIVFTRLIYEKDRNLLLTAWLKVSLMGPKTRINVHDPTSMERPLRFWTVFQIAMRKCKQP
jgi:hypothetical protein